MSKKILICLMCLLVAASCLFAVSCKKDPDPVPEPDGGDVAPTGTESFDVSAEGNGSLMAEINYDTKTLTVTGSGAMKDWDANSDVPWAKHPTYVQNVMLPDTLSSIGAFAFKDCSEIVSVNIPASVTKIGVYAFFGCEKLASVTVPAGVTEIAANTFENCSALTSLSLPNGLQKIGYKAFYHCVALEELNIPSTVTNIDSHAFRYCKALEAIVIPDSVRSIGLDAFRNCDGVINLTLGNNLENIGDGAFAWCSSIASITIPDNVVTVGSAAFENCTSLLTVRLGAKVASIGNGAFVGCPKLVEVINMSSLTVTSGETDNGGIAIHALEVHNSATSKLTQQGDFMFYPATNGTYLLGYVGNDTNVVFPEKYKGAYYSIYKGAIVNGEGIESLTIPFVGEKLNSTENAFLGYIFGASSYTLNSKYVPSTLTTVKILAGDTIGDYAFIDCASIQKLIIPNTVKKVGYEALTGCDSLVFNEYDNGLYLGTEAAKYNILVKVKSTDITACVINAATKVIYYSAFSDCNKLTEISIPNSVKQVGNSAFRNCTALNKVTIPFGVGDIGPYAFAGCTELTSITFPNSVKSLGGSAFRGCTKLSSIAFGTGINTVGDNAFNGCKKLTEIKIPNSINTMGEYVFANCEELTKVVFQSGLSTIPQFAFSGCKKLKDVTFGNVSKIDDNAFNGCEALTSLTLNVSYIGDKAFYNCNKITTVTIGANVSHIGTEAFGGCSEITAITFSNIDKWFKVNPHNPNLRESVEVNDKAKNAAALIASTQYWERITG